MLALRSLIRTNAQLTKNVIPKRNMTVIATPARNKVSTGEIIFLASLMVIGWTAVPAYVMVNIKHYRDRT